MQCYTLGWMFVFILFGSSAYGADIIEKRDQVVAKAGNLESLLIMKLFSTMESDIKELRDEIKEQQVNHEEELAELKANHEEKISELKAKLEDQPPTVYAQAELRGHYTYSSHDRVKFTSSVANVGNAYNNVEGYFMAPCDGLYLFSVSLCTTNKHWITYYIYQDGNIISDGLTGDSIWHTCSSKTVVTYMLTGSKVWVEIYRVNGGGVESDYGVPSFTGVLLNTFKKP